MKYVICGKTYSNLKAVQKHLELIKYSVQEGDDLSWVDTTRVFSIFQKFGMDLNAYKTILVRRRTRGGRLFIAFNETTGAELQLSVSGEIKRVKYV